MGAVYTWQTNTCLPIFCFLRVERATRQRHPLLQQVMRRSKLPALRWKRSFQLGTFSGDGKASTSPTANKCLFANLLHLWAERATRQRRPLLKQVTSRSKLPVHRWKRSFQLGAFSGDANANSYPRQTNTYLPIFYFL